MNSLTRRCFARIGHRWRSLHATGRWSPGQGLRRSLIAFALVGGLAAISAAQVVAPDPILEPITKSGVAVEIVDFIQVPASSSERPLALLNFMSHAGDGSGRLFVADSRGKIYIIRDGRLLADPFLDIAAVRHRVFRGGKRHQGFRSFAFHPDFARPETAGFGKLYTAHMEAASGATKNPQTRVFASPIERVRHHDVIAEWRVHPDNPDRVDPASYREIFRIAQPYSSHNVSQLAFNPNVTPGDADYGMLYIASGDGGDTPPYGLQVDAHRQGQNTRTPFGAILRINPLPEGGRSYSVPNDNPFVGDDDFLPEIWAFGFRNPQTFSWDTGGDHKMLIADIGQSNVEEINIGSAGANYGWGELEGTFAVNHDDAHELFALPSDDRLDGFAYPVAQYGHDGRNAIVGGFVYRGELVPELQGKYIFGDIVTGRIFYVDVDDLVPGRQAEIHELTLLQNGVETTLLERLGDDYRADLRFGMDEDGEIYILTKRDGMIRTWYQPFAP